LVLQLRLVSKEQKMSNFSSDMPSSYERRLIDMTLPAFAQAVRDIPDDKCEELTRLFCGSGPRAKLVWDQVKWRNMTSSQDDAISCSSDDEESKVENGPAISCNHERFLNSKSRSATKREIVKQKRHRQKEALIAQKCGHKNGSNKPKKTHCSNHVVEIVDPCDVAWDVYCDHMKVRDEECRLQLVQLLEEAEPITPVKPGPWDLDLNPYLDDMCEEMCGPWFESDSDEPIDWEAANRMADDSDLDW
jgi:hypothetical protein